MGDLVVWALMLIIVYPNGREQYSVVATFPDRQICEAQRAFIEPSAKAAGYHIRCMSRTEWSTPR